MITNAQATAKKNILEAISIQIREVQIELIDAKKDLASIRTKFLSSPHPSVERDVEAAYFDVVQCESKIKSLVEAQKNIEKGFGW
jgi:hypothetical protein